MAITVLIDGRQDDMPLWDADEFTVSTDTVLDAVGLTVQEYVIVYKLMSDGTYDSISSKPYGKLSALPNLVLLPAGTYKVVKDATSSPVWCGYEDPGGNVPPVPPAPASLDFSIEGNSMYIPLI